jgi:pimeloyl-ACP methyl ester carboxylesterase
MSAACLCLLLLQVSLVGHSAGAQLCMMALMQRAQAAHEAAAAAAIGAEQPGQATQQQAEQQQQQQQNKTHLQMPQQFVGVTGVYDIAKHYAYEKDRGVHSLSTMLPAMGGFERFAANSPSVILAAALQQLDTQSAAPAQMQDLGLHQQHPQQQQKQHEQQEAAGSGTSSQQQRLEDLELPACDFYNGFPLSGESIAHRIGESVSRLQLQMISSQCDVFFLCAKFA